MAENSHIIIDLCNTLLSVVFLNTLFILQIKLNRLDLFKSKDKHDSSYCKESFIILKKQVFKWDM